MSVAIGNSGEHYVMGELLKRKFISGLTPRNTTGFDIIAIKNGKTFQIRVKTKSGVQRNWQLPAKRNGKIFLERDYKNDFIVFVDLTAEIKDMQFYIVPTELIEKRLQEDYKNWITTPGAKGQKRNEHSRRDISMVYHNNILDKYINNWKFEIL